MSCKHFLFACVVVLYGSCAGTAQDFSKQLNNAWKDKVFVLKQCCGKDLTFNEQGELLSPMHDALAPVAVSVKSVKLKNAILDVRAERFDFALHPGIDIASPRREGLRVTIKLDGAPNSSDRLQAALQRIFISNASNADLFPAYMQACARGQILKYQGLWHCELAGVWSRQEENLKKVQKTPEKEAVPREVLDFRLVDGRYVPEAVFIYGIGKDVIPPKAVDDPEPEYSETARQLKVNGSLALRVVISEQGNPEHIQVIAPAGYGLDERAVAVVSKWRFQPATYHGKPVPVAVTIEVNFRLY